jgi:hypothetical protein
MLCLTLHGNQFDCRPVSGDLESSFAVFLWDTTAGSCFANIDANTMWNRSPDLPTLSVVALSGFNVTGNLMTNDPLASSRDLQPSVALWVVPGPPVNYKDISLQMMTITGNTVFGLTNLAGLPRPEWRGRVPQGLDTWEFFNTALR